MPWWTKIFYLFPIAGLFILYGGVRYLKTTRDKIDTWEKTIAVVTEICSERGENGLMYRSQYSYLFAGKKYSSRDNVSSGKPRHEIHQDIAILVNPSNPDETDVDDRFLRIVPIMIIVMGITFITFGSFFCWLMVTGSLH